MTDKQIMKKYWLYGENKPEARKLAERAVMFYLLNWGQTNLERLQAILPAMHYAGFTTVKIHKDNGFYFDEKVDSKAKDFIEDVKHIERYKLEYEIIQVVDLMEKYKNG